jgi:TRAP-type mannitol/chloroaromatic compound transport system substrate-binding protein
MRAKKTTIKWRMQTYAGAALAAHVCKPAIDAFNKVANGEMVIELYNADQLVPTGELFRAMQKGTIDCRAERRRLHRGTRWMSPFLGLTSPLLHATPWMFPCCGTGTG